MGQAAPTNLADVADCARKLKRNRRAANDSNRYTGNLFVYRQLPATAGVVSGTADVLARRVTLRERVAAANGSDFQASSAKRSLNLFVLASELISRHSSVATGVLVVLAAAADASSFWSAGSIDEQAYAISEAVPEQMAEPSSKADPETSELTLDPRLTELDATQRTVNGYELQIQQMLGDNRSLQNEKEALNNETIDLNKELLQLDWKVAAMESEAHSNVETVIVYNFVDAAAGGSIASNNSGAQPYAIGTQSYEQSIAAYDNYELIRSASYTPDDFAAPEEFFDPSIPGMGDSLEEFGTPFFN